MTKERELNIKPSCTSEILAFPADESPNLWEKIKYLVENPLPDGKLKKKLKGHKDIYRLRVGDYRVFYTFGNEWVRLLGVRKRDERTYGDRMESIVAGKPALPARVSDDQLDQILAAERKDRHFQFSVQMPQATPLPRQITPDWLQDLKVPPGYAPALCACTSEESLLAANVPSFVLERVVDNLIPRPLTEVQQQPDLVIQEPTDLVRYKDGELISFLLKLDEDQLRLTEWALKGPTMVKGGAGTGKSTVALYRVRAILSRRNSSGAERVLFTTYTRALMAASRQLLQQLLTPEQAARVRVATCDEIAREIVARQRRIGEIEPSGSLLKILGELRKQFAPSGPTAFDRKLRARALTALSDRYLLEEFEWIIDGRGLKTLEEYQEAPRPGRGCVFRPGLRAAVWELHAAFLERLKQAGIERFVDIRAEALEYVQAGKWKEHFDYVLVDEAQDLTPAALCLMAEVARSADGLFLAADNKQSLYSRNYTWSAVHPRLHFTGRTAILKRNYRSTGEIDRAAFGVLAPEVGEALEPSESAHSGPLPIMVQNARFEDEGQWAARFIRQMARHLRLKISSGAVLVPTQEAGQRLAEQLTEEGVAARYFPGRELDLRADQVKVLTLYSAKGLEFPMVVVAGLEPGTYPVKANFEDVEVYLERMRHERRLLYVGLTRAMRGLMLVVPEGCEHEALKQLPSEHWYVESGK